MARNGELAQEPNDLGRMLVERMNAGDLDGVVALYEPDAALALPGGRVAIGSQAIREFFAELLANRPTITPGDQQPALVSGDLALTSTRFPNSATAEVARRQPDGSWLWAADQPNVRQ